MASEDGEIFIKNLAQFVKTHEKALANALQLKRQPAKNTLNKGNTTTAQAQNKSAQGSLQTSSASSTLASALSLGGSLSFTSQNVKTAKLTLTPHHLFYLLSRFEDLGVEVGPLNVRVENLHTESSPANYVSFLSQPTKSQGRSDRDSVHSVSSVRSVMSGMSSFWSGFGFGGSSAKGAKAQAQLQADLRYLYAAFTMIPCLRLSPDRKARLIRGYEEFPFDTAVPLVAFKNVSALEIVDLDFRSFFGWDKMADQLRSLTIKRGKIDDLLDLLVHVVLDDMDKRRRRSSTKTQATPPALWQSASPQFRQSDIAKLNSPPTSPAIDDPRYSSSSPRTSMYMRAESEIAVSRSPRHARNKSLSPSRPASGRPGSSYRHVRGSGDRLKRSGSGSSNSSTHSLSTSSRNRSSSNLLTMGILPASKWRFLRHLCIADNGLTELTASGLSPVANTLVSLDLSSNLFTEVPDCLAMLTGLRALNLSNCMIKSLHSLARSPLPAITALNLRANRLVTIAGIERLLSLERLDIRDNRLTDPTEMARLTAIPDIHELWVLGNPFVKSHSNYRVTIFNLFRGSPGYSEDVTIDSYGPGYSERRQLRERAAEAAAPIAKAPSLDFDIPIMPKPQEPVNSEVIGHPLLGARPMPQASQSEMTVGSSRRKKIVKRRIVDLTAEEAQGRPSFDQSEATESRPPQPDEARYATDSSANATSDAPTSRYDDDPFVSSKKPKHDEENYSTSIQSTLPPTPDHDVMDVSEDQTLLLTNDLKQLSLGGEAYRQKIQALKDEFGSSWLRMLGEEGWHLTDAQSKDAAYTGPSPAIVVRQDLSGVRTPSQGIVSGGRTLG